MDHFEQIKRVIPTDNIGLLKDMATQVIADSARLEGSIAPETAENLGEQLRLLNSYHSNRIEGHKTGILDIRKALDGTFRPEDHGRYNQQLCAAHVRTEKKMMELVKGNELNPFDTVFLPLLHKHFYNELPPEHQHCHTNGGFTKHKVMPGQFRDKVVSVDGIHQLGPDAEFVPELYTKILHLYSPNNNHGDDRLLAILSSHHRLTWLHPFRDGNGRMTRLHTTAAMAYIGVNQCNLWSLSRAFSREKQNQFAYQVNLQDADSFTDESLADFIMFCLDQCLDQIQFIGRLLNITTMENRIEHYFTKKLPEMSHYMEDAKDLSHTLKNPNITRLMCSIFRSGKISRGEAYEILGVKRKRGGELIKPLIKHGLLLPSSERGPLLFGFPEKAMPEYFQYLYKPSLMFDSDDVSEGMIVKDNNEIKIALKDGFLRRIGPWNDIFQQLLGKKITGEAVLLLTKAIPYTPIIDALYDILNEANKITEKDENPDKKFKP